MQEVTELFSDVFGVPADRVTPSTKPEDIEKWDSLGHLMLVEAMEERFNVTLEMKEIFEIVDAGSLDAILRRHGALRSAA